MAVPHILCRESSAQQAARLLKHALLCVDHPQQVPAMRPLWRLHCALFRQPHGPVHSVVTLQGGSAMAHYTVTTDYSSLCALVRGLLVSTPQSVRHIRACSLNEKDASGSVVRDCYSVTRTVLCEGGLLRKCGLPMLSRRCKPPRHCEGRHCSTPSTPSPPAQTHERFAPLQSKSNRSSSVLGFAPCGKTLKERKSASL